jgi:hypothetical protein
VSPWISSVRQGGRSPSQGSLNGGECGRRLRRSADSHIRTEEANGDRVALRQTLHVFGTAGQAPEAGSPEVSTQDSTCEDTDECEATDEIVIAPGQSAGVDCVGVHGQDSDVNRFQIEWGIDIGFVN